MDIAITIILAIGFIVFVIIIPGFCIYFFNEPKERQDRSNQEVGSSCGFNCYCTKQPNSKNNITISMKKLT